MNKTSLLLVAGSAIAATAAYFTARRRKANMQMAMQQPVKKSRHLNPVFSHLKQEPSQS
ncbi:MAG: LPXTG cell wall anchor domain-containing protein [Chitinophagaceae bacterium]|nr:MAG: LPXTG cell wall anchor domain-containing protein [Chitinophagaceae bacterium]